MKATLMKKFHSSGRACRAGFASMMIALVPAMAGISAEKEHRPPNIIVIFSDDHAWQAISAYGDDRRLVETPNIDRLAREGMRFDRCLVTNSICGPSRAAVLTGKYAHVNGFYNNETTPLQLQEQSKLKYLYRPCR